MAIRPLLSLLPLLLQQLLGSHLDAVRVVEDGVDVLVRPATQRLADRVLGLHCLLHLGEAIQWD